MLLIIESGGTKTDWLLINLFEKKEVGRFSTLGFNPYYNTAAELVQQVQSNPNFLKIAPFVSQIYFFGAGCSSPQRCDIVKNALQTVFNNASINVNHDILAAALATCGNNAGIACILGTGSNTCYFDGKQVYEGLPSLDYILGDEGSGAYFGKKIITHYLYQKLPTNLAAEFKQMYPNVNKESILAIWKNQESPKRYIAQFTHFLSLNVQNGYIHQLLIDGFLEFIDTQVSYFTNYRQVPVHFVGSVAFAFKNVLKEAAEIRNLQIGKIIKQPINNLAHYYTNAL